MRASHMAGVAVKLSRIIATLKCKGRGLPLDFCRGGGFTKT